MAETFTPQTLIQAIRYYSDLDRCQDILVAARWPDGVTCPTCGSGSVVYLQMQKRWQCRGKHSRRQFSVKVGTIFEDSPIKLDKWFTAIWLITAAKNGISSYEIHRAIGVTQKTAWFMLHRIRLAMSAGSFDGKLAGQVEVDETYVAGKVAVLGLLERNTQGSSRVRAKVIQNNKKPVLQNGVRNHVEGGSSIYSDALASYTGIVRIRFAGALDSVTGRRITYKELIGEQPA